MPKTHFPRSSGAMQWVSSAYEPPVRTTGNVLYVNSATGTATGPGYSPETAYSTISTAVAACTASNGDVVIVMPGHAETWSSAALSATLSVAGVSVIGMGVGESRPIITSTHVDATLTISAAEISVSNIIFKNDIDAQVAVVTISAAGATIENCEFLEGSAKQYNIGVSVAHDRATVKGCYFKSVATGADSAIKIASAKDRIHIIGNEVFGDFNDACIHNPTGTVATRLLIADNILTNLQSGDHAIELVSACTGVISRNIVNSTLAAIATMTAIDPGSCYCLLNYGSDGVGDVSGVLNPVADS